MVNQSTKQHLHSRSRTNILSNSNSSLNNNDNDNKSLKLLFNNCKLICKLCQLCELFRLSNINIHKNKHKPQSSFSLSIHSKFGKNFGSTSNLHNSNVCSANASTHLHTLSNL